MPLTENHHMIEAFSPNRADQPFGKGILPVPQPSDLALGAFILRQA